MKKKEAYKHLKKLWKKMQLHFKAFSQTQDPGALHHFRVQVKKIRSFLTLLESNKKNNGLLKQFKPVQKVFKSAGVIRDAYLHKEQAKAHHIKLSRFYEEQDAVQKEETQKLLQESKKHLRTMKAVKKRLRKHLHPVADKDIKTFFSSQLDLTHQLLGKHNFSEQLHEGRKMLKHLMYNEHVVQDGRANDLHIDFDYVDKLQDVLGQWHDNKLALAFFTGKKMDTKEIDSMKAKNEQLEQAITDKANDFNKRINIVNPSPETIAQRTSKYEVR